MIKIGIGFIDHYCILECKLNYSNIYRQLNYELNPEECYKNYIISLIRNKTK